MALTAPHGPLGTEPAGWFSAALPPDVVYVEPHPRRVQAIVNGVTVIDTEEALLVHRPDHFLRYAFPAGAVGDFRTAQNRRHPATSLCRGELSTPGSKEDTCSSTTRRSIPPCRLSTDPPSVAGRGYWYDSRRYRRHHNRCRACAGAAAVCRTRSGEHRMSAAQRHHELLRLQGRCDLLDSGHRQQDGARRRMEL